MRLVLVFLFATSLAACGGGGGGKTQPKLPGKLIALAVAGLGAPGGGTYDTLPERPVMDAARNGWVAFVLPVGGEEVLFVAQPDGTVVRVFAEDETAPDAPNAETIESFECVWMCSNGTLFAYVELTGTRTFALIAATVAGGLVTGSDGVLYDQDAPTGVTPAKVDAIDVETALLADGACRLFFLLTDDSADTVLYGIDADGTGGAKIVETGDAVDAETVDSIDAFGVSEAATTIAVVLDLGVGSFPQRIYKSDLTAPPFVFQQLAKQGDLLPVASGGGQVDDAYKNDTPIYVYDTGLVIWLGFGTAAPPDQILLLADEPADPLGVLARSDFGAAGSVGTMQQLDLLNFRVSDGLSFPLLKVTISGDPTINFSIYAIGGNFTARYLYNGRPFEQGGSFAGTLPGLAALKSRDGGRIGSFAFRDILVGGPAATGIFWAFINDAVPHAVALEGDPSPDGDQFGPLSVGGHTVAQQVLVFRATLVTAGSGLYRQGP